MSDSTLEWWLQTLHEITDEAGFGFCHDALPGLLPENYHGPLVIALDSSILIDLQDFGLEVTSGSLTLEHVGERRYFAELMALSRILHIWQLRDIRFILTPRARIDSRKIRSEDAHQRRMASIDAIADSLSFQLEEWGVDLASETSLDAPALPIPGLKESDRRLVEEAVALGAHVFLTRDNEVVARAGELDLETVVARPSTVAAALAQTGAEDLFSTGGVCGHVECPYGEREPLLPDIGKWSGLYSIFDG